MDNNLIAIKSKLQYFYEEIIGYSPSLDLLLSKLVPLSNVYPNIITKPWIGSFCDMLLMSYSHVKIIALTKTKDIIIGNINNGVIVIDKVESGVMEDSMLFDEITAVIII